MCGIFGWLANSSLAEADLAHARDALARLNHRGPDAGGEWRQDNIYLGHRRLSIIDLSNSAGQPFVDPTGRFVLVFNGEIYNYLELRNELDQRGEV